MSDQAKPDPVQVLKDTRRTMLQLVANIDAAIAASKGQEDPRPTQR